MLRKAREDVLLQAANFDSEGAFNQLRQLLEGEFPVGRAALRSLLRRVVLILQSLMFNHDVWCSSFFPVYLLPAMCPEHQFNFNLLALEKQPVAIVLGGILMSHKLVSAGGAKNC